MGSVFPIASQLTFPLCKSALPLPWGDLHMARHGCRLWITVLCWSWINPSLLENSLAVYLFQFSKCLPASVSGCQAVRHRERGGVGPWNLWAVKHQKWNLSFYYIYTRIIFGWRALTTTTTICLASLLTEAHSSKSLSYKLLLLYSRLCDY